MLAPYVLEYLAKIAAAKRDISVTDQFSPRCRKPAAAWPLAFVVACVVLRTPIEGLLGRLEQAKHKDTTLTFGKNQQSRNITAPTNASPMLDAIPQDTLGLIKEGETIINEAFTKEGITSDTDRLQILTKHFVNNQLRASYSEAEYRVFGSQISVMQALNTTSGGVELGFIRSFYDAAKNQYPDLYKTYDFESWLNFIKSYGLVNTEDDRFYLTVRGRGFLAFLVETGSKLDRLY